MHLTDSLIKLFSYIILFNKKYSKQFTFDIIIIIKL